MNRKILNTGDALGGSGSSGLRHLGEVGADPCAAVDGQRAGDVVVPGSEPGQEPRQVGDVHEVPGGRAVPVDGQGTALTQTGQERSQDTGVGVVERLTRADHVLRADDRQRDASGQGPGQERLTLDLGLAVEGDRSQGVVLPGVT